MFVEDAADFFNAQGAVFEGSAKERTSCPGSNETNGLRLSIAKFCGSTVSKLGFGCSVALATRFHEFLKCGEKTLRFWRDAVKQFPRFGQFVAMRHVRVFGAVAGLRTPIVPEFFEFATGIAPNACRIVLVTESPCAIVTVFLEGF